MDTTTLAIAGAATVCFVGVLVWKGVWFLRKINEEPGKEEPGDGASKSAEGRPDRNAER